MSDCSQSSRCRPADCSSVFEKVVIWPQIRAGDTRIEWQLKSNFSDTGPYVFQIQVGRTGLPDADDWENVGATVTNGFFGLDPSVRLYGKFPWTHYRIKLVTANNTYYSVPQPALGNLSKLDWNRAREIIRMETVRLQRGTGKDGYLLKRRLFGEPCSCIDKQTKEILKPHHLECYGTGIVGGYFEPYPCVFVELDNIKHRSHLDAGAGRGTIDDDTRVTGRMLNIPQIFSYDVWVDKDTDNRWLFHTINSVGEVRSLPIILKVEMRKLPYSHPVYNIRIDGQVPE